LPDFSGMVTTYTYVLFGGMFFVVLLAAARALGADFLHHEIVIDHGTDVGLNTHVETGTSDELQDASAGPSLQPGLVKFHGMTMMTISIFLVSFAAMGILTMYYVVGPYNLDPLTSIPMSGVLSAVLAVGLSYAAFKYFIASAAGSEISLRELIGKPCQVTVGTSGSELGEVRCDVKGQIMSMSARSTDGSRISVGDQAQIIGMTGNIAVIQRRN
jgi:membrane protein implicated in regulation of membrane protease activity